jgi:hypothetical protein
MVCSIIDVPPTIKHAAKSIKPESNSESWIRTLCPQNDQPKTPRFTEEFLNFPKSYSWCSIKDDYRTLAELEGINVVNLDVENEWLEDDE